MGNAILIGEATPSRIWVNKRFCSVVRQYGEKRIQTNTGGGRKGEKFQSDLPKTSSWPYPLSEEVGSFTVFKEKTVDRSLVRRKTWLSG